MRRLGWLHWLRGQVRMIAIITLAALCGLHGQGARAQADPDRYASIVLDAGSGAVLTAVSADEPRYPASLTKLMTLYLTFEALRDHRIGLTDPVPVSEWAAEMAPSKLGLTPATRLTVEQAIMGLVTKSANDAAAALGEMLGGSEPRFGEMMTLRARALGMTHTVFRNASGLPDPDQITTARDLGVLARRIIADFPGYYGYFSVPSFVWRGRIIPNHDHLLQTYPGADGLKTGYTRAAGFNLITSAQRGGIRLIGVVMGAPSGGERDMHMAALLDAGFDKMGVPAGRAEPLVASRSPSIFGSAQAAVPTREPPTPTGMRAGVPTARLASATPDAPRWSIQVGAFDTERAARAAALTGQRFADDGEARVDPVESRRRTAWRAQVVGLTAAEAQGACAALAKRRMACLVRRLDQGQYASR